jgi:hypothetical protein
MREFIKIVEGLNEAPMADLTVVGDPNTTNSFGSFDSIKMQKPDFRPRMFKAFSRTPHVFEVFIINSDVTDADDEAINDEVDDEAIRLRAGFHRQFTFMGQEYVGQPGKIKVLLLSNLSPFIDITGNTNAKIALTPWILAHKIGHSLQDGIAGKWESSNFGKMLSDINKTCVKQGGSEFLDDEKDDYLADTADDEYETEWGGGFYAVDIPMTSASARNNRVSGEFEVFPELIAQYLIKGKVILELPKNSIISDQLEKELNARIKLLFDNLNGYVLVEV